MNEISLFNILIEGKEDSVSWTTPSVRRATFVGKTEIKKNENILLFPNLLTVRLAFYK